SRAHVPARGPQPLLPGDHGLRRHPRGAPPPRRGVRRRAVRRRGNQPPPRVRQGQQRQPHRALVGATLNVRETAVPETNQSEVKAPTDLVAAERAQLLLPKLTDDQLATLTSYGVTERTSVGQILATPGDLAYDLMVVLEGEIECSDIYDGRRRPLLLHGPRD